MGLTTRHKLPKISDTVDQLKKKWSCVEWSDPIIPTATCLTNIIPHERIHSYKMYENGRRGTLKLVTIRETFENVELNLRAYSSSSS
jgi:hypothetical protein